MPLGERPPKPEVHRGEEAEASRLKDHNKFIEAESRTSYSHIAERLVAYTLLANTLGITILNTYNKLQGGEFLPINLTALAPLMGAGGLMLLDKIKKLEAAGKHE